MAILGGTPPKMIDLQHTPLRMTPTLVWRLALGESAIGAPGLSQRIESMAIAVTYRSAGLRREKPARHPAVRRFFQSLNPSGAIDTGEPIHIQIKVW